CGGRGEGGPEPFRAVDPPPSADGGDGLVPLAQAGLLTDVDFLALAGEGAFFRRLLGVPGALGLVVDEEVQERFAAAHRGLLGALLDAAVVALRDHRKRRPQSCRGWRISSAGRPPTCPPWTSSPRTSSVVRCTGSDRRRSR